MCYSKTFKLLIKTWTSLHIIDKSAGGGGQFGLEQCICNGARSGRPWPSATKFLTLREPGAVYLSNKRSLIKSTWSSRIHKTVMVSIWTIRCLHPQDHTNELSPARLDQCSSIQEVKATKSNKERWRPMKRIKSDQTRKRNKAAAKYGVRRRLSSPD